MVYIKGPEGSFSLVEAVRLFRLEGDRPMRFGLSFAGRALEKHGHSFLRRDVGYPAFFLVFLVGITRRPPELPTLDKCNS